jgi:hypothetical protein
MADFGIRPPSAFNFDDSDPASQWYLWKNRFNWFLKATKKDKEDEVVQVSVLITCLGIEGARIYDSFVFADQADKLKIQPVLREFDGHFRPQKSETFERFKFVSRWQAVEEPFDKFLLALKGLIASCNYGTQRDSLLRDQIVVGIIDSDTREQLLSQSTLDLKKAVEICRARESARNYAVQMQSSAETNQTQMQVNWLSANRGASGSQKMKNPRDNGNVVSCRFCGGQHSRGKCPAYGKSCAKCGLLNHYAKVCEQTSQQQSHHGGPKRFDGSSKKSLQQQTPQSKNCDSLQTDSEVTAREFIISSISTSKTDDS